MPTFNFSQRHTPDELRVFARRLRVLLTEQGMSPSGLARAVGVSPTCAGHWVKGENYPKPENFAQITTALKTTREFLEKGENIPAPASGTSQQKGETVQRTLPDPAVVRAAREKIAAASGFDVAHIRVVLDFEDYAIAL
jgi:hypothetical protein